MEEEYRMQKTQGDIQQVLSATSTNGFSIPASSGDLGNAVIHEDGTVVRASEDDQASTRGIKASSPTVSADANGNDDEPVSAVPTIRISTESSRGNDNKEEGNGKNMPDNDEGEKNEEAEESESESKDTMDRKKDKGKGKEIYVDEGQDMSSVNGVVQQNGIQNHDLERPVQAAGEGDQNMNEASSPAPAQEPFSFSNKRLCERWLDNLFMVLYEVSITPSLLYLRLFNNRFT